MASKSRQQQQKAKGRSPYVVGGIVALILAALTVLEYYVGIAYPSATVLFLIALVKAVLVLYFFMHVYRLWRPDDEGSH
ncbi:MAG: cytochrome C oxidase subunit IV family protein [Caldilineaceae bacterium]